MELSTAWGHAYLPVTSGLSVLYGSGLPVVWYSTLESTIYDKIVIVSKFCVGFWDESVNILYD